MMIKLSLHQEDMANLKMNIPNNRAANYVKQKVMELKGEVDILSMIVEDFSTSFSTIERRNRQNH